mmetsp:Transcript_54914/g.130905  ORF Transcript_54914/g.130905 Transcript_54914/m.130905 type:complete len:489 (+) Transcript_54914:111-1577(+)|eukprot:CAMPEP_0178403998 /NCGR_PEP_ID=MMETSP0689_2-20121128/17655_1 /TAXON_ID=160604 /ORGANISM="Amphidinium massartii, Strain CS-259" /LENGTH=488 /DNA_ID=CAMNT_0020024965 /DNA_START=78 /DNA_END=1544 /DNA_ORIENTATION=+
MAATHLKGAPLEDDAEESNRQELMSNKSSKSPPGPVAGHGPFISNVSPNASPSLNPAASPDLDGEFSLELQEQEQSHPPKGRIPRSDEPAYVFPATPSPYLQASFPSCGTAVPPLGAEMVGFTPDQCDIGFTQYEVGEASYGDGTGYSEELGGSLFDSNTGMSLDGHFWAPAGSFGENGVPMDGVFEGAGGITAQQIAEWAAVYGWQPFDPSMLNGSAMEGMDGAHVDGEGMDHNDMSESQGRRKEQDAKKKDKKRTKGETTKDHYNQYGQQGWGESSQWADQVPTTDGNATTDNAERTTGSAAEEKEGNTSGTGRPKVEEGELEKDENGKPVNYTTVMLRNIPNKYTREMLIDQLSRDFRGEFDFLYLPIDFKNKCNVGYGFINFRTVEKCAKFVELFDGVDVRECLPGLNSKKVCEVTPARVQGFAENVRRLRNSPVMNQLVGHPEWMPVLFNEQGEGEDFPQPDTPLPPMKPRGRGRLAHIKGLD